jgi:hypothetical protein
MPRRAARTDDNQTEIVDALRKVGCSVQSLAMVGQGVPDILVGFRGRNWLFEIKDGSKPPSRRNLTNDEETWHLRWDGQVKVIESVDDVLRYMDLI